MADKEEKLPAAAEPPSDPASERIWDSPMPIGDPVPFDPALHEPTLSPEEIEKLLDEDDEE